MHFRPAVVPRTFALLLGPLLIAAAVLAPTAATAGAAETKSFVDSDPLFPAGDANSTIGPANKYPATIAVSGVTGTVLGVTATVFLEGSGRPEDIDMALVGPNGGEVILMSDACGDTPLLQDTWTFTDRAPGFLSFLACASNQAQVFRPTNYRNETGPEEDNFAVEGGPTGPFVNTMAALAGGSPSGAWKLFVLDDEAGTVGFTFTRWALNLEIEPAPPVTTAPPTTTAPTTSPPTTSPPAPQPGAAPVTTKPKTGKRARALALCFNKKSPKARHRCRRHAAKLPL
jgi:hypothetical protein